MISIYSIATFYDEIIPKQPWRYPYSMDPVPSSLLLHVSDMLSNSIFRFFHFRTQITSFRFSMFDFSIRIEIEIFEFSIKTFDIDFDGGKKTRISLGSKKEKHGFLVPHFLLRIELISSRYASNKHALLDIRRVCEDSPIPCCLLLILQPAVTLQVPIPAVNMLAERVAEVNSIPLY